MKLNIAVLLLLMSSLLFSQNEPQMNWPREIDAGNFTVTLYQPQLETLKDNKLDGRLALSVKNNGTDKIIFGALWFTARLSTDLESRTALLESLDIPKIKFPDIENEENIEALKELIIRDLMSMDIEMSIDNIISNLETVATSNDLEGKLSNQAPAIYFRKEATVLVSIDGSPKLKTVEGEKFERVVNTPFFIVKKSNSFYLKGEQTWYKNSSLISNDWNPTKSVPNDIKKFAEKNFESQEQQNSESDNNEIPNIIVVTEPSEMILTTGEIDYKPINKTTLLYISNTESDIILEIESQTHFLLLNGRWYGTKSLKDQDWKFVEPERLPESFKKIPADIESISAVRVSIPGTDEAKEAMYEQHIPQTAVVDRKTASTKVTYDGAPKFELIENTTVEHAVNTQSTVLKIDQLYYVIDDGIWFESNDANGPWKVSDKRPEEVNDIPPSSPVYNVKYVYIYDSTPEVVYVGYTPGYYHSYMYGGVVMYGTGYYYTPWYGMYYYPRPVTYGFGVHYNPYTGWGFSVGVSYGWMTVSIHSHGYWGPAGYRHGYRHGYHNGYHHGYHNGYAAGYARGRYDSNNVYKRNNGNTRNGVSTRNGSQPRNGNKTTLNRNNPTRKANDLFTDKSGNVHQRDNKGNWKEKRNLSDQRTAGNRSQNSNTNRASQRSQLESSYNNRNRGNTNFNNFSNNRPTRGTRQSMGGRRR